MQNFQLMNFYVNLKIKEKQLKIDLAVAKLDSKQKSLDEKLAKLKRKYDK